MKLNIRNCILLDLLLLGSMVLLKCTNSPLVIHSLNFIRLFHLEVLLIIFLPVSFVIFFHLHFLMITLAKIRFLLLLKLRMKIFPKGLLFPTRHFSHATKSRTFRKLNLRKKPIATFAAHLLKTVSGT